MNFSLAREFTFSFVKVWANTNSGRAGAKTGRAWAP